MAPKALGDIHTGRMLARSFDQQGWFRSRDLNFLLEYKRYQKGELKIFPFWFQTSTSVHVSLRMIR